MFNSISSSQIKIELEQSFNEKLRLELKVKTLEEELEKQSVVNNNLNARIKMLEYHLTKSISGINKKKSKSSKKK